MKIRVKNANPVSNADFFYFGWYGNGGSFGTIKEENCGSVASDGFTWTGKDICGIITVKTPVETYTHVFWTVKKSGITKQYSDSVFVKRGADNDFSINY